MKAFPVTQVPFESICVDPEVVENLRGDDVGDVSDLVESILEVGLLNPLTVMDIRDGPVHRYIVAAGFRRWKALNIIREREPEAFAKVDVRKYTGNSLDALVLCVQENLLRESLPPHKLCDAIEKMGLLGLNQEQIAKRISRTQGFVSQRVRLKSKLSPACWQAFAEGKLPVSVALNMTSIEGEQQQDETLAEFLAAGEAQEEVVNGNGDDTPVPEKPSNVVADAAGKERYRLSAKKARELLNRLPQDDVTGCSEEALSGIVHFLCWLLGDADCPFEFEEDDEL